MKTLPIGRRSKFAGSSRNASRWIAHQTSRPSVSMFTLQTPSLAAGRYWSSSTPLVHFILPPALLMRSTHSFGTLLEPCMTMGKFLGRTFWISARRSRRSPWVPANL